MSLMIVLLAWCGCGVLGYGITLAHHQELSRRLQLGDEYRRYDLAFSVFFGLCGPLGLFVAFFMSGFAQHGLRWRI